MTLVIAYILKKTIGLLQEMILKDFYLFFNNMMLAYAESKHIICISPKKVKELLEEKTIKENNIIWQRLNHYKNHAKEQNLTNMKFILIL